MRSWQVNERARKDDMWALLLGLEVNLCMGIRSKGLRVGKETHPHAFIHLIPIPFIQSFLHRYYGVSSKRDENSVCVQLTVYSCELGRPWS